MAVITINEINNTTKLTRVNENIPVVAIFGTATWGPFNTPTELGSTKDLEDTFGISYPANHPYGRILAETYLSKNGGVLFTRIGNTNAAAASATIDGCITITANYAGTQGNNVSVNIIPTTIQSDTYYRIFIYQRVGKASKLLDFGQFTIANILAQGTYQNKYITITPIEGLTAETVIPTTYNLFLKGGSDGDDIFVSTKTEEQQNETNEMVKTIYKIGQELIDPQLYEFAMIAAPGLSGYKGIASNEAIAAGGSTMASQLMYIATERKDCIAIIDPFMDSNYAEIRADLGLEDISTPYVAVFYPWYYADIIKLSTTLLMPPSTFYLTACATSFQVNKPWHAVAGPLTGTVNNINKSTKRIGYTQARSINEQYINPITYSRNYGYYLDGNNVLNQQSESRTYSQLSIRQAINYTKRELNKICQVMSYKQNSSLTRAEVLGRVSTLLQALKTGEAIFEYRAYIDDNNVDLAEGIIHLTVKIYPTPALEEFVFDFEIVNVESAL